MLTVLTFVLLSSLAVAGDPSAPPQLQGLKQLGTENNKFALNLYAEINKVEKGNIFFGPLSITTALGMVRLAAGGNTSLQIEQVMGFDSIGANIDEVFGDLNTRLYDRKNNYTLTSTNGLFADKQFTIKDKFLEDTKSSFNSAVELTDFRNAPEIARGYINNWVKNNTEGKITDLMPKGSIESSTVLVLANVMYFQGTWTTPFDSAKTVKDVFYISENNEDGIQMDFMYQEAKFPFLENADLEVSVLELSYLGDDLSLYVVLPNERMGLAAVEEAITIEVLETLVDPVNFITHDVIKIWLPKFEISQNFDLVDLFIQLGIKDLFDMNNADLSGISSATNLYMSAVHHKAFVTINENGTVAAAASAGGISVTSEEFRLFKADHPFMFFIREKSTGAIVFLGRVQEEPLTTAVFGRSTQDPDDVSGTGIVYKYEALALIVCAFVAVTL